MPFAQLRGAPGRGGSVEAQPGPDAAMTVGLAGDEGAPTKAKAVPRGTYSLGSHQGSAYETHAIRVGPSAQFRVAVRVVAGDRVATN